MQQTKKQVIINADDFGMTPGVTAGILYAHQFGIVTSTTAMVNTPFVKDSLGLAKGHPNLGVGLHFVLDAGKPISRQVPSLVDANGYFLKGEELSNSARKEDIKVELLAQLELLLQWYPQVTHIDSHHHKHLHIPQALEAVLEVAEEYRLPVRSFSKSRWQNVRSTDYLHYDFYGETVQAAFLENLIRSTNGGVSEIMCHPAFLDTWLLERSSYTEARMKELELLTDKNVKNILTSESIELIHFGGIHDEHK
ncbi:carbohydrate deacetylase [Oceanobacillus manasiensis]|uniref:carbohydrate deacetylase n=1 Tax=Oceanobacillus manasiensis TaxID=586413 RepID=UPI0005A703D1|nr:carbohydrate deacetylase [Oceanobacillus manasiensis]